MAPALPPNMRITPDARAYHVPLTFRTFSVWMIHGYRSAAVTSYSLGFMA